MNPLLEGVRILDLSRLLPAPYGTQLLCQLGAEVIKVEAPGGEYGRQHADIFDLVNRGKRAVELDLKAEAGRSELLRLARDADVLVESFRPGVMDRLGCGYDAVRAINPRIVYAALTGYGHTGPYRDRPGHDANYLAYAGVLDQTGHAGGPPAMSNLQIADVAGGGLTCALAIVSAVFGARQSGEGTFIDCAMLDGSMPLAVGSLAAVRAGGTSRPRGSDMLNGGLPNYRLYETADGKYVAVGALEAKFFARLCHALGRPELAEWLGDRSRHGALAETLGAIFKGKTRDAWDAELADADCCVSGVLKPEEALSDPQVVARGLWETDARGKPAFRFPAVFSHANTRTGPVPAAGQDNEALLSTPDVPPPGTERKDP